MKCSVCKNANLSMADRNGIEVDYCPDCRGVWLDRGELDKLIERAGRPFEAPASRGHEHYPRRKKSLLREIFDFD